jgi:hypothetical protein
MKTIILDETVTEDTHDKVVAMYEEVLEVLRALPYKVIVGNDKHLNPKVPLEIRVEISDNVIYTHYKYKKELVEYLTDMVLHLSKHL